MNPIPRLWKAIVLLLSCALGSVLALARYAPASRSAFEELSRTAVKTTGGTGPLATLSRMEDSVPDLIERIAPALVALYTPAAELPGIEKQGDEVRGLPGAPMELGLGSGVVVSPDGGILTLSHLVPRATLLRVRFSDGRTFIPRLIGRDEALDLALLKVDARGLRFLPIADATSLKAGHFVLALGRAPGWGVTVRKGIISATGRTLIGSPGPGDLLETDAGINAVNLGGALITLEGHWIGINLAAAPSKSGFTPVGFALPTHRIVVGMRAILDRRASASGELGIRAEDWTRTPAESEKGAPLRGARIVGVTAGGAAERGGLKRDDIILSIDGEPVGSSIDLWILTAFKDSGSHPRIEVWRRGITSLKEISPPG